MAKMVNFRSLFRVVLQKSTTKTDVFPTVNNAVFIEKTVILCYAYITNLVRCFYAKISY